MLSLNKHQLIGYSTDVSLKDLETVKISTFSVATNRKWTDKSGETKEATDWHVVKCFGQLGEIANDIIKKGSHVYVSGRSQNREWEDKEGIKRYTTEIIAEDLILLDKKQA